ncbi:MAG: hypothetical protein P8J79_02470 [Halioglobus sp.]|nr:hypothetical protein [Halioglobus sp.]
MGDNRDSLPYAFSVAQCREKTSVIDELVTADKGAIFSLFRLIIRQMKVPSMTRIVELASLFILMLAPIVFLALATMR